MRLLFFISLFIGVNSVYSQKEYRTFLQDYNNYTKYITEGQQCYSTTKDSLKLKTIYCFYVLHPSDSDLLKVEIIDSIVINETGQRYYVVEKLASISQFLEDTLTLKKSFNKKGKTTSVYDSKNNLKVSISYSQDDSIIRFVDTIYYSMSPNKDTIVNEVLYIYKDNDVTVEYSQNHYRFKTEYFNLYNQLIGMVLYKNNTFINYTYYLNGSTDEIYHGCYSFKTTIFQKSYNYYDGKYNKFHLNGQIAVTGSYSKGAKTKEWKYFNETGKLIKTELYKNGVIIKTNENVN